MLRTLLFRIPFIAFLVFLATVLSAQAKDSLSVLLTSNLQGNFSLEVEGQETTDPLLLLAQNIIDQKKKGIDLYLDMGNAFYPGVLSKYSSGSIMMDFLDYFSCSALLVSSKDLQVGTNNLEFLQKDKTVHLLSANIVKDERPIFTPWFKVPDVTPSIAILGISSGKVLFDIAEEDLYGYSLEKGGEALVPYLDQIREAGIQHVILLCGGNLRELVEIMESFPEISMAICGGDNAGRFFAGKASRVDLSDGRSIVITDDEANFFRLDLTIDDTIAVNRFLPIKSEPIPTYDYAYHEFKNRLTLWKEKFREDEVRLIENLKATETDVNDMRFAQLLRDRFDCEIAVVEKNTLIPLSVHQDIKSSDFLTMVNRDYFIFLFSLTGNELHQLIAENMDLVIAGLDLENASVQGYDLEGARPYRIAASQPAMHAIGRMLRKRIPFTNTWMTVTDLLKSDLKDRCVVLNNDYDFLDRRFRTTVDIYLSNFIDNSGVKRGDSIEVPPGQPSKTYNKWGLENEIEVIFYNKYHRFVFTPYMLYSRQDEDYLNNILKGTFLYEYNWRDNIRPYSKFRCDSVVERVDGMQPILLRETLGISGTYKRLEGKIGLGFEKEVQDPANAALYGIEILAGASIPFLSHFTYTFDLDAFSGIRDDDGSAWQIRSEINNSISAAFNDYLALTFRHKYFYVYEESLQEYYQNSQFITSLDFTKDWKFW